jgi:putative inorganic carbon (HCO3(-)) transporter
MQRIADLLGQAIFAAVLVLLVLAAVAYGGSDPWWKAFFTSAIFAVSIVAVLELMLSNSPKLPWFRILLPVIVLVAFSVIQTLPLSQAGPEAAVIQHPFWNSISADPYETRIFALQLAALALLAALLFRFANTERRLRRLTNVIIAIAVVSAVFGLLRQTMQHQPGFGLPLLQAGIGYGQFINKNHFAFLMEMGFGLSLGLVAAGGVRRDRAMIYLAVLLPIWMALVLANSRGGILAMLFQLVVTLLLFPTVARDNRLSNSRAWSFVRAPVVRLVLVLSLIVLCATAVLWVGGDRLATSIEAARGEFTESRESREGVTRLKVWRDTIEMIKANPITGVGMGGYWTEIPRYHQAPGSMTPQQAHNDYLELVAGGGIVGLVIFLWFVAVVIRHARSNLQSPDGFRRAVCFASLIAIAGVAVHSLMDFGLHRMANAMIFAALIVIATGKVSSEAKPLNDDD